MRSPGESPFRLCIPSASKLPEVQGLSSSPAGTAPCLGPRQPARDLGYPWLLHVCLCESGAPEINGSLETEGLVLLLVAGSETMLGWKDLALRCFNRSDLPVFKNCLDIQPLLVFTLTPVSFPETHYEVSPGSVIPSASLSLEEAMPLTGTFVSFHMRNPLVGCLFFSLLISLTF